MMRSKTEDRLHEALDARGIPHRQSVHIGRYEVDFVVGEALIIEVDGYHHLSRSRQRRDAEKSAYLRAKGYRVRRIAASEVWMANKLESFIDEVQSQLLCPDARGAARSLTRNQLRELRSLRRTLARGTDSRVPDDTDRKRRTPQEMMLEYLDAHFPEKNPR